MSKQKKANLDAAGNSRSDSAISIRGFHLFARNSKLLLRELVLSSIDLTASGKAESATCIKISRCQRQGENFRPVKAAIDYAVHSGMQTLHLHDIFLSPDFGILVEVEESAGSFLFEADNTGFGADLLLSDAKTGRKLKPCSYARTEIIA